MKQLLAIYDRFKPIIALNPFTCAEAVLYSKDRLNSEEAKALTFTTGLIPLVLYKCFYGGNGLVNLHEMESTARTVTLQIFDAIFHKDAEFSSNDVDTFQRSIIIMDKLSNESQVEEKEDKNPVEEEGPMDDEDPVQKEVDDIKRLFVYNERLIQYNSTQELALCCLPLPFT